MVAIWSLNTGLTVDDICISVAVIAVFGFLMIPVIRGIMSTMTPPDKQGKSSKKQIAIDDLNLDVDRLG